MHIRFQFMGQAGLVSALLVMAPTVLAALPELAAGPEDTPHEVASVRELAPAQLTAIRAIGRNVLAAKKSAVEDPADAAMRKNAARKNSSDSNQE